VNKGRNSIVNAEIITHPLNPKFPLSDKSLGLVMLVEGEVRRGCE